MVSLDGVVTVVTSTINGADESVVVDTLSSLSPQELTVNIKIMERIMRIYLKELPDK